MGIKPHSFFYAVKIHNKKISDTYYNREVNINITNKRITVMTTTTTTTTPEVRVNGEVMFYATKLYNEGKIDFVAYSLIEQNWRGYGTYVCPAFYEKLKNKELG